MKPHRRRLTAEALPIDPDLERRWQEALLTRPLNNDATALAAWNQKHGDLLSRYQRAVDRAQDERKRAAQARSKFNRRVAAAVISVLLAAGGIVYWTSLPSEDEIRMAEMDRRNAACTAYYEQAHHVNMVDKQIDLLQNGEAGWLDIRPFSDSDPAPVGGVTLTPAELLAGKTGTAQINHERYVQNSTAYIGPWALVERQNGRLILTLFALSGFGDLPHDALKANTASEITVRGETASTAC